MKNPTSKRLRITILVYAIWFAVWGLLHVINPELLAAKDPAVFRIPGAAMVTLALGAGLVYLERAKEYEVCRMDLSVP
jgi:hypothetical protein